MKECHSPHWASCWGRLPLLAVVAGLGFVPVVMAGGPREVRPPAPIAAMVTDINGLGDQGFNDGAYQGLVLGLLHGFEMRLLESNQATDYLPNLQGLAEDGARIVFAVGFPMEEALISAARQHRDTFFAGIDVPGDEDLPNLQGIVFREEESGYLAGVVAGLLTRDYAQYLPQVSGETNVVGVVIGMDIPAVERYEVGFIQGVASVNKEARVLTAQTGNFTDPQRGRAAAEAMIAQGADVIFHAAGNAGRGVIEAARDAGILAIGADTDQNYLAPDTVVTSAIKKIPESVVAVLQSVARDSFTPGTVRYGLAEDATGLAPFHAFGPQIPPGFTAMVEAAQSAIVNGFVEVATTREEIDHLLSR